MTSPQVLYALRWLVYDTFCEALASRVFWIMLSVSALCIVFCAGVRIDGGEGLRAPDDPHDRFLYHRTTHEPLTSSTDVGKMHLLFGVMRVDLPRERLSGVQMIQLVLGSWIGGAFGVLTTLIWSASLVPAFLQPANAALLFAKPIPRWVFLVGKFAGVVLFVGLHASIFFLGTWFALGLAVDVWTPGYLAGAVIMVLHFAGLFSFTVLLATLTRSTVASVLGVLVFWCVCMSVNYARHTAYALPTLAPETPALSSLSVLLADVSYWVLPKPADFMVMLEQALHADAHMATLSSSPEFHHVLETGAFDPVAIVFATLGFCVAMLASAASQLHSIEW